MECDPVNNLDKTGIVYSHAIAIYSGKMLQEQRN